MTKEGGVRERKKLATRTALADSALRLSVRHGVEGITVAQIAADAGVSLRTFFNYFSTKEEAIVAGDVAMAAAFVAAFARRPAGEPVLEALKEAVLDTVPEGIDRERVEQLRSLRRTPSLLPFQLAAYAAHEQRLAEAVATRLGLDPDADPFPALVAAAVMAGLRVTEQRWLNAAGNRGGLRAPIEAMVAQLAAGFSGPV
jgi:AcrR family transcriptional regulator